MEYEKISITNKVYTTSNQISVNINKPSTNRHHKKNTQACKFCSHWPFSADRHAEDFKLKLRNIEIDNVEDGFISIQFTT